MMKDEPNPHLKQTKSFDNGTSFGSSESDEGEVDYRKSGVVPFKKNKKSVSDSRHKSFVMEASGSSSSSEEDSKVQMDFTSRSHMQELKSNMTMDNQRRSKTNDDGECYSAIVRFVNLPAILLTY
jgi:hypothetical protein